MSRRFTLGLLSCVTGVLLVAGGFLLWQRPVAEGLQPDLTAQVVRLHVVANSDSDEDQALKRAVRDAVMDEATPLLAGANSPAEVQAAAESAIPRLEEVAARVVAAWGKAYPVHAEYGRFEFPGKAYGSVFLPAGRYSALKVVIGKGEGANWWCVLFPPLCFADWTAGVVQEPKPGTGGRETVPVERPALVDEEKLEQAPVRARFAIWEKLHPKSQPAPKASKQEKRTPTPRRGQLKQLKRIPSW